MVADAIRGEIRFRNRLEDDPVIARADGSVLYNFAVAVDDADMGITDVIRGDDHLSNTPAPAARPRRRSERRRRATPTCRCSTVPTARSSRSATARPRCRSCAKAGYLPAAVRNYLALLGWGAEDDETILSTSELVERFSIDRVGRAAAIFDEKKLRWLNGRYMRELPLAEYEAELEARPRAQRSGGRRTPSPRRPPRPEPRPARSSSDKAQTMTEVWPLIAFLFVEPEIDEKAWRKAMKPGVERSPRRGGGVDRRRWSRSTPRRWSASCAA